MRKVLYQKVILFLFLLASLSVYAVNATVEENIDVFKKLSIAQGTFVQKKYFKVLKQPIISKGDVFYHHVKGFIWHTKQPIQAGMIFKHGKLFSYEENNALEEIKGADLLSQVIMSALSGDISSLKKEFNINQDNKDNCLKLTPINQSIIQIITTIKLCHSNNLLNNIELIAPSGNRTDIAIRLSEINHLPELISEKLQ